MPSWHFPGEIEAFLPSFSKKSTGAKALMRYRKVCSGRNKRFNLTFPAWPKGVPRNRDQEQELQ